MRRALALLVAACGASAVDRAPVDGGAADVTAPVDASAESAVAVDAAFADDAAVDAEASASPLRLRVRATGQSDELVFPIEDGGAGVSYDVRGAGGLCFQVDALSNGARVLVGAAEPGIFCRTCDERAQTALGAARFVFPSKAEPLVPGETRLVLGLRDCDTLTPTTPPDGGLTLEVTPRSLPAAPARGLVHLDVLVTSASIHAGQGLSWLAPALDELLAPVGIRTSVTMTAAPAGAPTDALFSRSDVSALDALVRPLASANAVRVVLAGCLRSKDPATNAVTEVQGYTPHIPGGVGSTDAIFIQGTLCGTPTLQKVNWPDATLARLVVHELGHYLGLYHPIEEDGTADQLADTDGGNLMARRPTESTARGLTSMQGAVMRRHPAVTPD